MASRRKRLAEAEPWQRRPWHEVERINHIFAQVEKTLPPDEKKDELEPSEDRFFMTGGIRDRGF
jgi:hypothetical protein